MKYNETADWWNLVVMVTPPFIVFLCMCLCVRAAIQWPVFASFLSCFVQNVPLGKEASSGELRIVSALPTKVLHFA